MLEAYPASGSAEVRDIARVRLLLASAADPFDRLLPLHLTGSAVVLDVSGGRVLLRWHERQRAWLQPGGHGDPGETDPAAVAVREAVEETGLVDLAPLPVPGYAGGPVHVVIVPVRARGDEPVHEHADVRYVLTTRTPASARAENAAAPLRWVDLDAAVGEVLPDLAETLRRSKDLLRTSGRLDARL